MTVALARRLIWEGVVAPEDVSLALQAHVTERVAFIRALIRREPDLLRRLEAELGHLRDASVSPIVPDALLLSRLPHGLAQLLLAVPVARDPVSGVVRVVAADPSDHHIAVEMSHHLGAPVEVVAGPLRALLDAVTPSTAVPVVMRPSDHPIPLVRVSPDTSPPRTVKGVAPQASGAAFASSVVVPPRLGPRVTSEPVIQLTRTKSILPSQAVTVPAPDAAAESSGPSTIAGSPSAPLEPPPPVVLAPDTAIVDFQSAATPEDVVSVLVHSFGPVAKRVIVLAVRGKVFEGRDTNDDATRDAVRALVISADRPSVPLTAVQTGRYVGPMPQTPVHQDLSRLLGDPSDDIAVGAVTVAGRAALVYVVSGLDTVYLATRRGEELAAAASLALERIVRKRKK